MTTPKVRASWPIGFTPADLQRAQAGPRGPQDPVTISTGNAIGVHDDDPGEGTWHYRIGYPSQASPPVFGPWAAIAVAAPGPEGFDDATLYYHPALAGP